MPKSLRTEPTLAIAFARSLLWTFYQDRVARKLRIAINSDRMEIKTAKTPHTITARNNPPTKPKISPRAPLSASCPK